MLLDVRHSYGVRNYLSIIIFHFNPFLYTNPLTVRDSHAESMFCNLSQIPLERIETNGSGFEYFREFVRGE